MDLVAPVADCRLVLEVAPPGHTAYSVSGRHDTQARERASHGSPQAPVVTREGSLRRGEGGPDLAGRPPQDRSPHMKIREICAAGLRGATPEGGWSNELRPDDCVHTLVALHTDEGPIRLSSVFALASETGPVGPTPLERAVTRGEKTERAKPTWVRETCPPGVVSWPATLRRVGRWLDPWAFLRRCWHAWCNAPPPPDLPHLLESAGHRRPLNLYLRCQRTTARRPAPSSSSDIPPPR